MQSETPKMTMGKKKKKEQKEQILKGEKKKKKQLQKTPKPKSNQLSILFILNPFEKINFYFFFFFLDYYFIVKFVFFVCIWLTIEKNWKKKNLKIGLFNSMQKNDLMK